MKTIIARFTELKENVAGTADSEFEDLDYNKVDTALKSVGISLKDASGQFRNLDDVFLELSEKWNTLDRNSQRYIATIAAGSRQQSRFIAMMENYDRTIELVNTAYNSSGKSAEQFAKYQDTLEYKINKLQNSWEQLRVSLMNSNFFKGVVDTVGSLVKYLSKLNFPQIIAHIITIVSLLKTVSAVINGIQTGEKFKQIGKTLGNVKGLSGIVDEKMKSRKKKTTEEKIEDGGEKAGQKIFERITSSGKDAAKNIENAIKEGGKQAAEEISNAIQSSNEDIQENNESKEEKTDKDNDKKEKIDKDNDKKEKADGINNEENKTKIYQQEEKKRTEIAKIEELQRTKDAALAKQEESRQAALYEAEESKKATLAEIDESNTAKAKEIEEAHAAKVAEIEEANAAKRAEIEEAYAAQLAEMREGISGGGGGSKFLGKASKVLSGIMIGAEIVAAAASIGSWIGNSIEEKAEKIKEEQSKFYEDALKKINTSTTTSDSTTLKNDTKTLIEAQKTINDLQNKQFLSTVQQDELKTAISYMNENHANLVKSYDENTGKIELLNDSVQRQIEAQEANTEAILSKEVGSIGGNRSRGYAMASEDYGDDIAQDNQSLENIDVSNWTTAAGVSTGVSIASAIAAAAATFSAVSSTIPVVGWIVSGVSLIGAAIAGGIASAASESQELTQNVEETMDKIRQLDAATQDKIISRLNDQGVNIENLAQLENWISEDAQNQQKLLNTTTEILNEMRVKAIEDDAELALETYVKSQQYTDATGKEVQVPDVIIEGMITQGSQEEIDFNNKLTDASSGQSDLMYIQDVNTSNEDRIAAMKKYSYTDLEGNIVNLGEIFQSIMNSYKSLLNDNGEFKEFDLLTEDLQNIAIKLFGSAEKYSEVAGTAFSETQDIGIVVEDALNAFEGGLTAKAGKDIVENIQSTVKNRNYDDWMKELEKIKLGQEMTPQEAEQALKNLQEKMFAAGVNIDFVNALWGDVEVEGSFAQIKQKWTEMANNLKSEDIGFDSIVIDSLTGEGMGNLYNLITNVLTDADGAIKASLVNLYNNAFKNIQSSDIDAAAKSKVRAYISSIFTPENFDPALMGQYINELVGFGIEAEDASKIVDYFYKNFKRNDLLNLSTDLEEIEGNFEKTEQSISSITDAWEIFVDNIDSWSADSITSELLKTIAASKELAGAFNLSNFSFDMGAGELASRMYSATMGAARGLLDDAEETEDEVTANQYKIEALSYIMQAVEMEQNLRDQVDDLKNAEEDAKKASEKADKDLEDANKAVKEAEKQVYEAYHGSDLYMPSVGARYNYDSQLERTENALDRINTKLDDATELQEKIKLLNDEVATEQEASVLRLAKMQTLQEAVADSNAWLVENASQYISQMEDGSYILNDTLFNNPDIPDAYAEEIIRKTEEVNEWITTIEDLSNQEEEAERARLERQKRRRDDYISFLEEGADILKEQAEKEVAVLEEKYQALEDADNNYLDALEDAINKQRELREQEKQYSDLATKEKKLALMSRDTSGANQKEVQNLQKEIEDERDNLLNSEVDNLIDNMRTLAEEQAELRNTEIELKNAIIEETSYTKQFAEIVSIWTSPEDANAFYLENTDTENMTTEQIEAAMQSFADAYQAGSLYLISNQEEVNSYTEATAQMVEDKIAELGDFWIEESTATTEQVKLDVQDAKNEANAAYVEAINNANDASEEAKELKQDWNDASTAAATAEVNMKTSIEAINKTAQIEWEKTSGAMAQATIQALQTVMNDEAIMDYLGINKEQFKEALAGKKQENSQQSIPTGFYNNGKYYNNIAQLVKENKEQLPPLSPQVNTDNLQNIFKIDEQFTTKEPDVNKNQEVYRFLVNGTTTFYYTTSKDRAEDYETLPNITKYKGTKQKVGDKMAWVWSQYATGGLVDYTGPAWVDGTPTKPEAFLNAQDTQRIGEAAKILAQIPALNGASENVSTNIGDTTIEIHINVENIESDYDVDQMIERVKNDIIDVSKPVGTSVILKK